ncbi:hypothetical protein [Kovacikia minuta]|uniref:hypothetical protein n=1 Tax=Kovacikia minuta TaxID=2931930 RepID=UPI0020C783AF
MWVTSSLSTVLTPTAVALGNFDGIHQGHRQVIQPVLRWGRRFCFRQEILRYSRYLSSPSARVF